MSFVFTPDADLWHDEMYTIWISNDVTNLTGVEVLHRDWMSTFDTGFVDKGRIEGYVIDDWNGDPLEGVTVTAGGVTGTTGADGFYILFLAAGTYDVAATKDLYTTGSLTGVIVAAGLPIPIHNITLSPIINIDVFVEVEGNPTLITPETTPLLDVDWETNIIMNFEEAINEYSIDFILRDSIGDAVTGTIEYNPFIFELTFTPDANLTSYDTYTRTITDRITNVTGAPILPRNVTWQFTTSYFNGHHHINPIITPPDGAVMVAVDAEVKIEFGCEMKTTITEAAIAAAFGTGFTWSADNKTLTIAHDDFTYYMEYTVSVSEFAECIDGFLAWPASSTFTVGHNGNGKDEHDLIVTDENGTGIADVRVTFRNEDGDTVWIGSTDSNGSITFYLSSGFMPGTYVVHLHKDGYQDLIFTIDIDETGDILNLPGPLVMEPDDEPQPPEDTTDAEEVINQVVMVALIITIVVILILLILALSLKKSITANHKTKEPQPEDVICGNCGMVVSDMTYCEHCGWSQEVIASPPMKLEETSVSDEEE
jgi:hypothetical protein